MAKSRPYVVSIAGLDPTAGAGVLADIKTFEQNRVYGMGVISAHTYQVEDQYIGTKWLVLDEIIKQLNPLLDKYPVQFVKIGLIENFEILGQLCNYMLSKNSKLKIIFDPILKASASQNSFHEVFDLDKLHDIFSKMFLITPNWEEIRHLSSHADANDAGRLLSEFCHVYLKGGHRIDKKGYDRLFVKGGKKVFDFRPKHKSVFPKHGSGCVLSSALTANFSKDFPILRACLEAKEYTESVLSSNLGLLGWHKK